VGVLIAVVTVADAAPAAVDVLAMAAVEADAVGVAAVVVAVDAADRDAKLTKESRPQRNLRPFCLRCRIRRGDAERGEIVNQSLRPDHLFVSNDPSLRSG
jgi:hypothetical protein